MPLFHTNAFNSSGLIPSIINPVDRLNNSKIESCHFSAITKYFVFIQGHWGRHWNNKSVQILWHWQVASRQATFLSSKGKWVDGRQIFQTTNLERIISGQIKRVQRHSTSYSRRCSPQKYSKGWDAALKKIPWDGKFGRAKALWAIFVHKISFSSRTNLCLLFLFFSYDKNNKSLL